MKKLILGLVVLSSVSVFAETDVKLSGYKATYKITSQKSSDVYILGLFGKKLLDKSAVLTIQSGNSYLSCSGQYKPHFSNDSITVFLGCTDNSNFQLQLKPDQRLVNLKKGDVVSGKGRLAKPVYDGEAPIFENVEIEKQD